MYSSQSPRHSPTPPSQSQQVNNNSFDQDASSGSSSGSGTASSNSAPRSPSRSKSPRPHRVEGSSRFPEAKMETFQSFNAAYNAGPVYISEGLGSPVPGGSTSPNSSGNHARSNSPVHSRSSGSSQGSGSNITLGHGTHPGAHPPGHPLHHRAPDFDSMDVSSQLRELQRENTMYRQELDARDAKLSSSMNSIKTFWSPELKKERALRKEEAGKIQALKEQCKKAVEENQQFSRTIKHLKEELARQQKLNSHLQTSELSNGVSPSSHLTHEIDVLRGDRESMKKEVFLLKKTAEEREIRIETQKQTLIAREESIKKLLEMLQSKGLSTKMLEGDREEADRLRSRLVEAETRVAHLERMVDSREEGSSLERVNGLQSAEVEELRNLRQKMDQAQADVGSKNKEVQALHTKLNAMAQQYQDQQAHISLLKESLKAKEQHINMLQADMNSLRSRIEEKEMILAHQDEQLNSLSSDKSKRSGEVNELKEIIDLKERKVAVLQKKLNDFANTLEIKDTKQRVLLIKIDNLQEQLQEKNHQLEDLRGKVKSLEADSKSSDNAMSSLEEALMEKDKSLMLLREQKEKEGVSLREDSEKHQRQTHEMTARIDALQKDVNDKESGLLDLKEHASQLASAGLKKDSKITTLEINLAQTKEELCQAEEELKKWKDEKEAVTGQQVKELNEKAEKSNQEAQKLQSEVDRILEIMKDMEGEKNDKDNRIKTLEGQLKEANLKFTSIKKDQQNQKKANQQLLEEAKKREGELTTDTHQLQSMVKEKSNRLEELEEALKESVSITADREMILAQQTQTVTKLQKQLDETKRTLQAVQKKLADNENKLTATQAILEEKDNRLKILAAEGRKHLEEALETKQEALTAAIGEKDAHIALLELNRKGSKTSDELKSLKKEKDALVQQLKDETQKRLKLLHHSSDSDKLLRGNSPITPEQYGAREYEA
ncbi:ELKS/Rab6-interacting/CAST family member 1-like isoform X1 [Apostichopus japonicus]|uniref:ELKS/Rab6-interacting/CAST family member 1-like isoform X1 n=1 Tax=Stichopus japonicus TaxID=307972 RepID=UPI003AB86A23